MSQPSSSPKPNVVVSRQVWVSTSEREQLPENEKRPLSEFRDRAAWVLLGEPGSGKSTSFQEEAEATGGIALHLDDFLDLGPDPKWNGKTLFLDGLDEVRARSGDSIVHDLRSKLKEQGYPRFRVACRAADWSGSMDQKDLTQVSPDEALMVLILEPLSRDEINQILQDNHGVADPAAFIEAIDTHGLQDLLGNPQTLEMLVKARRDGRVPSSHEETYRLACEMLAEEINPKHHHAKRHAPCSAGRILEAAGHLCAAVLLTNQRGIALAEEDRNRRSALLETLCPPDSQAALRALDTRLFKNEGANILGPCHRTIAEYLGARWLADRVDQRHLPLGRVLNLLVGPDARSVHGLRGLYAWLATLCLDAQAGMIQADPVTVLTYGDPKILGAAQKRAILAALRSEAEWNPSFAWDAHADKVLGGIACAELIPDFIEILEAPERGEAQEILVRCVLDVLQYGAPLTGLGPALWRLVEDGTHWQTNRKDALRQWWKQGGEPGPPLDLLSRILDGRMGDEDDEFLGILLGLLYPAHLSSETLLDCLHSPKEDSLFGAYRWFIGYVLPKQVDSSDVPILLDGLVERLGKIRRHLEDRSLFQMADALVLRGLQEHGDSISGERLYRWLSIGSDLYGNPDRGSEAYRGIGAWLGEHPNQYKGVLDAFIEQRRGAEGEIHIHHDRHEYLHGASIPGDLGRWHFEKMALEPNEKVVRLHLREAIQTLWEDAGNEGLSLEDLFAWVDVRPEGAAWLEPLLSCEVPSWRLERKTKEGAREAKERKLRVKCHHNISGEVSSVRYGAAPTSLMSQLAKVWLGRFSNTQGPTPSARFQGYCEPWEEVLEAAETGFPHCLNRPDIPTAEEIIALSFERQEFHLQDPCLVGMELRWSMDPTVLGRLPEETLRSLVAFFILSGEREHPLWFQELCRQNHQLVAWVFVAYVGACWDKKMEHIFGLDWLHSRESFLQQVASTAIPVLLSAFPWNASPSQFRNLEGLLKVAFAITPELLPAISLEKGDTHDMDHPQAALWLLTRVLTNTEDLSALWENFTPGMEPLNTVADFVAWMTSSVDIPLKPSPELIGGLIQRLGPYASSSDLLSGPATSEGLSRDVVRRLITALGSQENSTSEGELERLLGLLELNGFSFLLKQTRAHQRSIQREARFKFLEPNQVAKVLADAEPASIEDLTQLTLEHLDSIKRELGNTNEDGFRSFWNLKRRSPESPREENDCRDQLMLRLRYRLLPLHIECAPEFDYSKDKRADLRVSYRTDFALPIEIKRDSHPDLWTGIRTQLIPQYTTDHLAQDHGIYLVFWFGGKGMKADPSDGQRPTSVSDLKARLENQLHQDEIHRVFIRVIDVSWPGCKRPATSSRRVPPSIG